jgi:GH25 family lysozyme M1 (1,4-beta-N-acetylmuramidase)
MATKAIDVSRWNGDINYSSVKKSGIQNVLIQCGYGSVVNQKDPYFEINYTRASKENFKIGAYLYSYAKSVKEAKKEAKVCLSWIKGKNFDLPIYIDMEESDLTSLGKTTLTKIADAFCKEIEKAGYKAGVYANANWFTNYLDYSSLKKSYSIWLAEYGDKRDFECDIWQYSDTGRIADNACNFDMNYIYITQNVEVKFTKNAGLYKYPYKDTVGKTSVKVKTAKKGTIAKWLSDDGYGWSKVKIGDKTYYAVNNRLSKKNLSEYKKITLSKDTKGYKVKNGKLTTARIFKKGKKLTAICLIEQGKYKNYYLVSYLGQEYYLKK